MFSELAAKFRKPKDGHGGDLSLVLSGLERRLEQLEQATHGSRATYVGNNRVLTKIVTAGHNFAYLVEADDLLISPWFIITGTYETDLTNYFVANVAANSHCLDLGCNFGFFACLFSRFASQGRVIAVEADQHMYALCRDNLMINGLQNVGSVLHAAVNADGKPLKMYRRMGRSGNTSMIVAVRDLTDWHGEAPAQPFEVAGLRIDDLLARMDGRIDFIKIDVEGAEPLAFRGAEQTIAANPQIRIVMEWSPGQITAAGADPREFLTYIETQGLRFFDIVTGAGLSKDDVLNVDYMAGLLIARP